MISYRYPDLAPTKCESCGKECYARDCNKEIVTISDTIENNNFLAGMEYPDEQHEVCVCVRCGNLVVVYAAEEEVVAIDSQV